MRAIPVLLAGFSVVTAASAAPRLHVSTDTLQPESVVELILDASAAGGDVMGKPTRNEWLVIEPAWAGTTYWKEPNVLEFHPSEPPRIGAQYTFKLKEGHTYLDNTAIPAGVVGKMDSQRFQVDYATMLDRNEDDWTPRNATFFLRFNGDVIPEKVAPYVFFEAAGGKRVAAKTVRATFGLIKQPYYMGATWNERFAQRGVKDAKGPDLTPELEAPNGLVISPSQTLPEGKNWRLAMLKGLPDATGKVILNEDSSRAIGDIDPLLVNKLEAQSSADEPREIVANFNIDLPVDFDEKLVEVTPKPKDFEVEVQGSELHLKGDFSEQDQWNVILKSGIQSKDGRALANEYHGQAVFKPVDAVLAIPSQDEAQLASGTRKYRVQTVNLDKVHVRVKKLDGSGVIRAQQGYRYYTGEGANGKTVETTQPIPYELMVGETIADFEIPLTNGMDTSQPVVLDWDKILSGYAKPYSLKAPKEDAGPTPALKPAAAFFLELVGEPKKGLEKRQSSITQAIVQLTDIGLAWKMVDGEAKVFVFSTMTGKPLESVELTSYGEDAKLLQKATTDANGLATLPHNDDARHLQAKSKEDSYTVAYDNSLPTVSLWRFPVRESWDSQPKDFRKVFMFTDRSLYRPGETLHLKGVVRRQQGNDIVSQPAAKNSLVILDPQDREIFRNSVEISPNGSFDLSFALPAETTGMHTIRLEYPDEVKKPKPGEDVDNDEDESGSQAQFSISFRVDEFRRNAFEVKHVLTAPKPGAKEVSVQVKANSYQGQPIANGQVSQFTQIEDTNFYPEDYRDFLFGDHRTQDYGYWYHYFGYRWDDDENSRHSDNLSSKTTLAADGTATVTAKLPDGDFPMAREVTIATEVTDANQQTLNESTEVTVHPANLYVGIKRLDRLMRVGDNVPLEIIAVTPEGKAFNGDVKMEANLSREVNEQVKLSAGRGSDTVRNESKREQLSKTTLTMTGGKGTQYLFAPTKPGLHQVDLRGTDSDGHAFATSVSFQVYGGDEYPWAYEDGMKIKLVAEKKVYQPGETARVLVLSPIEGTALVTVEREKVLTSFLTELKADKPVLEIPVTDLDAPNVFVSVLVIKGAKDSSRQFKEPQLRLGYCELMVTDVRDRLKVDLATPADSVRPGDEPTISGTVTLADGSPAAGAEVTLYAEDEGTLAVMGYKTPEPMEFFYDPRTLRVNCGTTLDKLISESPEDQTFFNKGFFVGGGDDEEGSFKNLPRKDFNPCAAWVPTLVVDAAGKFSAKIKLPDTLTRYRVIAIASHGASKFGSKEGALTVNKDMMVEPQELRFANEGDTLNVQAQITNASKTAGVWKIHFSPGAMMSEPLAQIVGGGDEKSVTLAAGESTTVMFPVHFGNTGDAVFKWTSEPVSLQGAELTPGLKHKLSDSVENRFVVNYPMPLLRQSKLVSLKNGKTNLLDQMDPALVKGRGTVELEFSKSLLIEAGGSADFLLHYPYGCVEQTTSSMMPWLAANRLREIVPAFAKTKPEEVKKALQIGVNRLLSMQTSDGGFAYWPGQTQSLPWASPYAGLGLLMASAEGAQVPDTAIESLCANLERNLRGIGAMKSPQELEIACRSIWILALADKHPDSYINMLKGRMTELNPRARCMLALAAKQAGTLPDAAVLLRDTTPFKERDDTWMRWEADLPLSLLAWSTIEPKAKETDAALIALIQDRDPYGTWRTTWVNAWSLLGMAAYAEHENLREPANVTLTSADGTEQIPLGSGGMQAAHSFTLKPSLSLTADADRGAYVRVTLASKPDLLPSKPVAKNGLEVTRFYERVNPDGTTAPLDIPKKGDLIRVTLKIQQPQDYGRYIVVEDNLPSIFEAVNNDFASQKANPNAGGTSEKSWKVSHSEIRADRVMFFYDDWYRGNQSLTYLARCTMEGEATAPPAKVESMYDPDSIALSASRSF
jgi:uncharacterized protein YfaS (alpha-2-macroglobulin family)